MLSAIPAGLAPNHLRPAVSSEWLMAHCAEFAKRVKLSGSREERESLAYLEAELRGFGYATTLLSHDAYISLPVSSRLCFDGAEIPSITHSMSRATSPAGIEADLVFVGEGSAAEITGRDVAGRIVLVEGIATEEVAHLASRAGALGQIHVSPTEHLYEMCISPVWGSPSHLTRADLPTTAAATVSHDDGARLRARIEAGGVRGSRSRPKWRRAGAKPRSSSPSWRHRRAMATRPSSCSRAITTPGTSA